MKAYFVINEHAITTLGYRYLDHFLVSIYSCIERTNLKPIVIYDGKNNKIIQHVQDMGATVIYHELSFKSKLYEKCKLNNIRFEVASATFLKLDISLLENEDDYVLYCDSDVMFLNDIDISSIRPKLISATVGHHYYQKNTHPFSTGVMVLNIKNLKSSREDFINYILNNNFKTSLNDPYDQGHFNDFYKTDIEFLCQSYDWRPFWGINKFAKIIHWHVLKYSFAKNIIDKTLIEKNSMKLIFDGVNQHRIFNTEMYDVNPDSYKYYSGLFEYFLGMLKNNNNSKYRNYCYNVNSKSNNLLVGPSHCVRWFNKISENQSMIEEIDIKNFIAFGGAPLWSFELIKSTKSITEEKDIENIICLTPDYRYGNQSTQDFNNKIFDSDYHSINPKFMDANSDYLMLYKLNAAIKVWIYYFKEKIKFMFWNELARNIFKRLLAQPSSMGNIIMSKIIEGLDHKNIIDFNNLLKNLKMDNLVRMFLDDNAHPTGIGYRFLTSTIKDETNLIKNFKLATQDFMKTLTSNLKNTNHSCIFIGNSIFLKTFLRYLGIEGLHELNKNKVYIFPDSIPLGFTKNIFTKPKNEDLSNILIKISDADSRNNNEFFEKYLLTISFKKRIHFDWKRVVDKLSMNDVESNYLNKVTYKIIDQEPHYHPSEYGLLSLIKYLTNIK